MAENLNLRSMILEEIAKYQNDNLQRNTIFTALEKRVRNSTEMEQAFLTAWHDLFRTGILAWGYNILNPDPPFFHTTEAGRKILANLSRDPSNPAGYLGALSTYLPVNSVANSYVKEAIETYNLNCYRASAVMIGAATESIIMTLRDSISQKMTNKGATPPKDLCDWRIKKVIEALHGIIERNKNSMDSTLYERFETYWSAFVGHIRIARNEAGHPNTIAPLAPDVVHGSLLIFPELAKLIHDLIGWVESELS